MIARFANLAVDQHRHVRAGYSDYALRQNFDRGPKKVHSSSAAVSGISHQHVGHPERKHINARKLGCQNC